LAHLYIQQNVNILSDSQIAVAGDQELRRQAHSSQRGTMELGGEDNDGL